MNLPINEIVVGERRRQDLGDIQGLADSIKQYGLLHPVVVDENKVLVAGGRRLEAIRKLGWATVPVTLLQELTEKELRTVELEENIRRKDLTEIEKSRNMVELAELKAVQLRESSDPSPSEQFCSHSERNLGGRPEKQDNIRAVAQSIGISTGALSEARQHVAAVDKYPVLEPLPKKQAIQTAKQLDKLPDEAKPAIIHEIQKPKEELEGNDQIAFQRMERFKKKVDSMIEFFHLLSKQSPSDYFNGMSSVEKVMTRGFFAENKLSMIEGGIAWLQLFRDEFRKQLASEKKQELRRVK